MKIEISKETMEKIVRDANTDDSGYNGAWLDGYRCLAKDLGLISYDHAKNRYCPTKEEKTSRQKYGIKAYGEWEYFSTEKAYRDYLTEWMCGCEGAERDRAVTALCNLEQGIFKTNTDII